MLKKVIYFLLLLLLGIYIGGGYFFSNMLLQPQGTSYEQAGSRALARTGFDYNAVLGKMNEPQTFQIDGAADASISGWYFPAADTDCALVFAHGWGSNRTGAMKYARLFEDCSCDMVFYDHRAHNESVGSYATGGVYEAEDLVAVTDWLQAQNGLTDAQTGWVGVSWGAATVIQAGGQTQRQMAFILADSPFQDWYTATTERADRWFGTWTRIFTPVLKLFVRLRAGTSFDAASAISYVGNIKAPLFLIHSAGDKDTNSNQSVNISKNLPPNSVFHHTQWGSDHTRDITQYPDRYQELFDDFRDTYVTSLGPCSVEQTTELLSSD